MPRTDLLVPLRSVAATTDGGGSRRSSNLHITLSTDHWVSDERTGSGSAGIDDYIQSPWMYSVTSTCNPSTR